MAKTPPGIPTPMPGRMTPVPPAVASEPTPAPLRWPAIDRLDPATEVDLAPAGGWYAAGKPALDYLLAAVLLVPGLPVIGLCWLAVRLTSKGPGFYAQTRLGRDGRPYRIIKLRSMRVDAEAKTGAAWAAKKDDRVTPVGKFLRATHLDELPQLFNVLRGEMSLVGPRPERPEMIQKKGLNELIPGYRHRLRVKPGVTGMAQIQLPPDLDLFSVRHKVAYDLYYIGHAGLWLDLRLIAGTALKAVGVGPDRLRRLFALPDRDHVAAVFQKNALPPPRPTGARSGLQPAL